LTSGTALNLKASAHQRQLPESRDNTQNGRKSFAIYSLNKRLTSRIFKDLKKLNAKEQIIQLIKGQINTVHKITTDG
jgi:hypothetical protein